MFLLQPEQRKLAVLQCLAEFFGTEAFDVIDYSEKNWNEEAFNGGCPVSVATPGVISRIVPGLRSPFKRYSIFFFLYIMVSFQFDFLFNFGVYLPKVIIILILMTCCTLLPHTLLVTVLKTTAGMYLNVTGQKELPRGKCDTICRKFVPWKNLFGGTTSNDNTVSVSLLWLSFAICRLPNPE